MTTKMVKAARTFNLNGHVVPVKTLDEGRALWLALRDAGDPESCACGPLGASDMVPGCGEYREGGVLVARVSYNGRMWAADGSEIR